MSNPPALDELVGQSLGPYQVLTCIGSGGSATVYRARKAGSDQEVALKVSHPRMLRRRTATARFLRETKAIERLDHAGCVAMLDWGIDDGRAFIAMELVSGEDLSQVLEREKRFSPLRAVTIAIRVCEVLESAHALGVVHRDLKPRNIKLLNGGARVKLVDFGLAKLFEVPVTGWDDTDEETHQETLTSPSTVLGTPRYMAPEQIGGQRDVDARADLYALGVILYRMVTGRLPYEGHDALGWLLNLANAQHPEPRELIPSLDVQLDAIIVKCLEREPAQRIQTARQLRVLLEGLLARLDDALPASPGDGRRETTSIIEMSEVRKGRPELPTLRYVEGEETLTEKRAPSSPGGGTLPMACEDEGEETITARRSSKAEGTKGRGEQPRMGSLPAPYLDDDQSQSAPTQVWHKGGRSTPGVRPRGSPSPDDDSSSFDELSPSFDEDLLLPGARRARRRREFLWVTAIALVVAGIVTWSLVSP